jgi:hypothetical protein
MRRPAGGAQPARFDDLPRDGKAAVFAEATQALHDRVVLDLLGHSTIVADHELALVRVLDIAAGNKGADTFDFVDQQMGKKKVERTVDGGRPEFAPLALQRGKQRVGANRLLCAKNQFEDPPPHRSQPRSTRGADLLGSYQPALDVLRAHGGVLAPSLGNSRPKL